MKKKKEDAPEREPVLEEPKEEVTKETDDATEDEVENTGEFVINEDAIANTEEAGEDKFDFPSYFIEKNETIDVEIDILFDPSIGKIVSVSKVGLDIDFDEFKALKHRVEKFVFTIPDYDDISGYKQKSSRQTLRGYEVDSIQMRNFFIVWHLKEWTLCDSSGKTIKLTMDKENKDRLSDDSISQVMSISSSIMDTVLNIFEKDILYT